MNSLPLFSIGLLGGNCKMKATEAKLLDFLRKSPQFVIPIYQRTYSWTRKRVPAVMG